MEEDRRVPSNSDILVAIGSVKTEIVNLKKDVGKTEKNIDKIANNNVNQWKAIVEINTRCEERMKKEDRSFTLKNVIIASTAGGIISLLCNYVPSLIK